MFDLDLRKQVRENETKFMQDKVCGNLILLCNVLLLFALKDSRDVLGQCFSQFSDHSLLLFQ